MKESSNVHGVKYLAKELILLCKKKLCHVNYGKVLVSFTLLLMEPNYDIKKGYLVNEVNLSI